MDATKPKINSFTQLDTWKKAHQLVLTIYKLTSRFPKKEIYSLSDQMQRAVVSITSNIAEGFSRQSRKEKIRFYFISRGSLTELQNQLIICRDLGYLKDDEFRNIAELSINVHKLLNGLIKSAEGKV